VPSGQRTVPDARDEPFTGDMANSLAGLEGVRADGAVDLAGGRLGAVEVVLDAEVLELVQGILGGGGQLVELQQQHDQAMVAGDVPPLGLVQQRQRVGEGRLDVPTLPPSSALAIFAWSKSSDSVLSALATSQLAAVMLTSIRRQLVVSSRRDGAL